MRDDILSTSKRLDTETPHNHTQPMLPLESDRDRNVEITQLYVNRDKYTDYKFLIGAVLYIRDDWAPIWDRVFYYHALLWCHYLDIPAIDITSYEPRKGSLYIEGGPSGFTASIFSFECESEGYRKQKLRYI